MFSERFCFGAQFLKAAVSVRLKNAERLLSVDRTAEKYVPGADHQCVRTAYGSENGAGRTKK